MFGAGTVQWAWGLDNTNAWGESTTDPSGNPPDPNMEQATVNLFADMGVQPATLCPAWSRPAQVDGHHAPDLDDHLAGARNELPDGAKVTITGTATDAGGGVVAGRRGLDRRRQHLAPAHRSTGSAQASVAGHIAGSLTAARRRRS